jgi:hypothetical protein
MTQLSDKDYNRLENEFESANAWQCKHCGNLVFCEVDSMIEHLDQCEKFEGDFEHD